MEYIKKKLKEKKGFTLIEMIIVIAIIAILLAIIAPNMRKFLGTAKQTKADAAAKTLYTAAETFIIDKHEIQGVSPDDMQIPDGNVTWTGNGAATDTMPQDLIDEYLNEADLKGVSYTVTIKNFKVIEVTWTKDGVTGTYPKAD